MTALEAAKPGTVNLARFSPQVGQPFGDKSVSPFGIKVEVFLRMAGISYVNLPPSVSSLIQNRKRKLPTIVTDSGELIVDSTFIIRHLMNTKPYSTRCRLGICDATLSRSQIAQGTTLKFMCEESLYFIIGYWRYIYEPGFRRYCEVNPSVGELGLGPLKRPAEWLARRAIVKQLWAQGTGRHSQGEVEYLGRSCLGSIATILKDGDEAFLFGPEPSTYDATLFAFLSAILEIRLECPLQEYAQSLPVLSEYVQAVNDRCGWNE